MRASSEKYESDSEKAQKLEEVTISASKPNVWKVESDEDDSNFECYNKFGGKPVHVDIDKEVTEGEPALALLPNKSEKEEMNNNSETMGGNGDISVRWCCWTDGLSSVPYLRK